MKKVRRSCAALLLAALAALAGGRRELMGARGPCA